MQDECVAQECVDDTDVADHSNEARLVHLEGQRDKYITSCIENSRQDAIAILSTGVLRQPCLVSCEYHLSKDEKGANAETKQAVVEHNHFCLHGLDRAYRN